MHTVRVVNGLNTSKETTYQIDNTKPIDTVLQHLCTQFQFREHHSHFCLSNDSNSASHLTELTGIQDDVTLYFLALPAQEFVSRAESSASQFTITASHSLKHLNDHLMLVAQQDPTTTSSPIIISPQLLESIVKTIQTKPYFIDLLVRLLNWTNTTVQERDGTKVELFLAAKNALDAFEKRVQMNFYLFLLNDVKNEGMVVRCVNVANRLLSLAPDVTYMEHLVDIGLIDKVLPYLSATSLSLQAALATLQSNLFSLLDKRSTLPIDFENPEHVELLERIWYVAVLKDKYPGPESDDWRWLGFKGHPAQNFGHFILGLDNMSYFAMNSTLAFRAMLLEQSESAFNYAGYPMGSTAAQITALLAKVYHIGTPRYTNQPIKLLFGPNVLTRFNELYCTTFKIWDWLWSRANFSFPYYHQALSLLSTIVDKLYAKNLATLKEYEAVAHELLAADITSLGLVKTTGESDHKPEDQEYAQQPSNVKSYKLKKRLGASTAISIKQTSDNPEEDEEYVEDEEAKTKRLALERARRLRGFFGEWFDVKEVEFSEKLNSSQSESTTASMAHQPENAGVKLQKFFGERVRAPLRPMSVDDTEEALIKRSHHKLKQVLGETVDTEASAPAYASQPTHVKVYKLDRKFGEKTPYSAEQGGASDTPNSNGVNERNNEGEENEDSTHHKSLQKYFGERFDVDQVVQDEKLKPRLDAPTKAVQPENARVHKIHRFFGERMSIQVVDGEIVRQALAGGAVDEKQTPATDDAEDDDDDAPKQRKNTMLKARRQLGEGIDIEKESSAVNFAPQPGHVKAFKLDKMFGQRVPHTSGDARKSNKEEEDDVDDETAKERERRRRLQTFFGERFDDLDKVVQEEKLKASLAGEQRQQQIVYPDNSESSPPENAKKEKKKYNTLREGKEKKDKKETSEGRERSFTLRRKKKDETSV